MRDCAATGCGRCDGRRRLRASAWLTTRVGEPDAGNLHVRFDEGERRHRCSLLDCSRPSFLVILREHDDYANHDNQEHDEKEDFPEAVRVTPRDLCGVAVHEDLERLRAEGVAEQPDRDEHVFESPVGVLRIDPQIAVGVAGDLRAAELLEPLRSSGLGAAGGLVQHDLVVLDDMSGQKRGVVRHELGGRERFDLVAGDRRGIPCVAGIGSSSKT